jgi:hypothetical protein
VNSLGGSDEAVAQHLLSHSFDEPGVVAKVMLSAGQKLLKLIEGQV